MKKFLFCCLAMLPACGVDRSFEEKNIYGSVVSVTASSSTGIVEDLWPSGEPGVGLSQVIPESLVWKGYAEEYQGADDKPVDLTTYSWYDPAGDLGIDAVLVITAKHECDLCSSEAAALQGRISSWHLQGRMIKVVTLLVDATDDKVITPQTALNWKMEYQQLLSSVGVDPLMMMLPEQFFGWPYHTIVDPRTMSVVGIQSGIIDDYKMLEALADSNK